MSAMNKISLTSMIGALTVLISMSAAADISGTYKCSYHDPLSNPPDGQETITIKPTGETYKVLLTAKDSVVPYAFGNGLYNKNVSNAFAYIFWLPKSPTSTNIQFFIVKPDGSLDGIFAQSNKDKSGTETCTKSAS